MRVTAVVAWALMALLGAGCSVAQAQNRIALIVGNSHYQNAPPLPSTSNDADDLARSFERLGFATTKLIDATYEDFRRAVRRFNELTSNADIAVIYFGGHGIEVNGENWLLPVDADLRSSLDVANDAMALRILMQSVGRASDLGMVILDASRSNTFAARLQRAGDRGITRGLGRVDPAQNVLVAYASKEGTTAEDRGGRNSAYAAALLKYLETPGLDVNFMFRKVRDDVLAQTNNRQLPSVYGSLPHKPIYLKKRSITIQPVDAGAPAMPSDEAVWLTIKDSTDKTLFAEFLNKFPASTYVREAGARLQSLDTNVVIASRQTVPAAGDGADACDHLAASPLDRERPNTVAGVELSKIPVVDAARACEEAMRRAPRESRFPFQAARVAMARSDYAAARALFEKAGELGNSLAMYSLGVLYAEGKLGPADYGEARRWYEKAVARNCAYAMPELAALYEKGLGGPKDPAGAFRLYRAAATAGDQVSMTKVGNFYEAGLGIRKDYAQAVNWYRKGAERGDAAAMKQLGRLYESGRGVPRNPAEARAWYARAAKLQADAVK